jgi:multidrug transporter EmrE-like cation transporter
MLLKSLSTIALFLVGYFIYEEAYHVGHMIGIGLVIAGLAVLLFNPIKVG